MIRLFRLNTGSCGGCDREIELAVELSNHLSWANSLQDATAIILTGPITLGCRSELLKILQKAQLPPLLVIGDCAHNGQPFSKGGIERMPDLPIHLKLEGCPPSAETILMAVREALKQ